MDAGNFVRREIGRVGNGVIDDGFAVRLRRGRTSAQDHLINGQRDDADGRWAGAEQIRAGRQTLERLGDPGYSLTAIEGKHDGQGVEAPSV